VRFGWVRLACFVLKNAEVVFDLLLHAFLYRLPGNRELLGLLRSEGNGLDQLPCLISERRPNLPVCVQDAEVDTAFLVVRGIDREVVTLSELLLQFLKDRG